jgi:hypothetical protein
MSAPDYTSIKMNRTCNPPIQHKEEKESQFHKLGEVVGNEDDTGLVQVESLCMNCHENVCQM